MRTIPLTLVMTMLTPTNVRLVAPAARAATMMTTRSRAAAAVTTVTIVAATLPPVTPMPAPTRTMMISIPMTLPALAVPVAPAA